MAAVAEPNGFHAQLFCGGEIVGGIIHHHAVGRVGLHGGAYGAVGRFGRFVEQAEIVRAEQCDEAVGQTSLGHQAANKKRRRAEKKSLSRILLATYICHSLYLAGFWQ